MKWAEAQDEIKILLDRSDDSLRDVINYATLTSNKYSSLISFDIVDTLLECKTEQEFQIANKMLMSFLGVSITKIIETAKDWNNHNKESEDDEE